MIAMLFLASKSPRRRDLLRQLGIDADVLDIDVSEQRLPSEAAAEYVNRVAREKAGAGLLQVVALADALDASRMLRRLSGRIHQVVSVVWAVSGGREECARSVSVVEFGELSDSDITTYVATGESFGKAGAYAIQGRAAAFVQRLEGSYSGVMGLPLYETAVLLRRFEVV